MSETLYHYCSLESFLNIIQNKTLWLTDISLSNDNKELLYGVELIFKWYRDKYKLDLPEIDRYNYILNSSSVYVFCLSNKEDSLSQWRCYADNGFGIAIGFDMDSLGISRIYPQKTTDEKQSIGYNKVIYDTKCNTELSNLLEKVSGIISEDFMGKVLPQINIYNPFLKHPSFEEEDEWRIVYQNEIEYILYQDNFDSNIQKTLNKHKLLGDINYMFRNKKIIGHYEYSFSNYLSRNPIKKVYIGPNCSMEKMKIRSILERYGFNINDIDIEKSKSSYKL